MFVSVNNTLLTSTWLVVVACAYSSQQEPKSSSIAQTPTTEGPSNQPVPDTNVSEFEHRLVSVLDGMEPGMVCE